ncbi:MAG TPA: immunity 53 family protein [Candidatus Binatia bacterium]|jgi:hypothetical protein|nr:immunity 53 family protein [Candidatus Binatia bacterium]
MDELQWLQRWYAAQCNGDWEHQHGVRIDTLDNPGWSVAVQLEDTAIADLSFERVAIERAPNDWMHCWVENQTFEGRCGPQNLGDMLGVFRSWVESR